MNELPQSMVIVNGNKIQGKKGEKQREKNLSRSYWLDKADYEENLFLSDMTCQTIGGYGIGSSEHLRSCVSFFLLFFSEHIHR